MHSLPDLEVIEWRLHLRSSPARVFELLASDTGGVGAAAAQRQGAGVPQGSLIFTHSSSVLQPTVIVPADVGELDRVREQVEHA
jgi:hypothetical protein